ncbi:MAG: hypothetical protein GY942_04925, partial [Aestuariibacter sp.]|nr:hypothetical protein [Aestuariibacter sp.]
AASFTTEVFATATTMAGKSIRNGTTKQSFSIEKSFGDIGVFHNYQGMRVTSMALDFTSQSILTGTFGFAGRAQTLSSTTVASATTDSSTNTVMNASGNVGKIWEGGQAITDVVFQNIALSLDNNPRDQPQVGSNYLAGIGLGQCKVEGTFNAYFENNAVASKYVAGTETNLRFEVNDLDGNTYVVDVPKIRLADFTATAEGPNNDVMQDVSWGAMVDSTGTYAIQFDALDA